MVQGRRINGNIPYGKLPQRVQYNYCRRLLISSYNYSDDTKIFGTWELNSHGNVHFHFIMSDPYINSNTMLQILRRDVLNCEMVLSNLSKSMIDYCNNIVFVTDSIDHRVKYMCKDNNCHTFPYYYTKNALVEPLIENLSNIPDECSKPIL